MGHFVGPAFLNAGQVFLHGVPPILGLLFI
jgi:hypothetical protein